MEHKKDGRCSRPTRCSSIRSRNFLDWHAGAEQIAIAVDVVDPRDAAARICIRAATARERRPARANRADPIFRRRSARRVRRIFQQIVLSIQLCRSHRCNFRRESKSSHRKNGRVPPSIRSRSARSSSCRPPARKSSARGIRNPSIASPRLPLRCRRFSNRARSIMHSCATSPRLPLYSTGK